MRRIAATLLIVLILSGPAPAQFSPPVQERSTELTDVLRKQALALHERSSSDLRWTFTQTNAPFDLTGVDQVFFNYAPRTGGFTQVITGSVFNATNGIILIPFTPSNTATNGTFEWNIEVSQAGNPIMKSPFGDLNLIRRPGGGSTNVFPTTGSPIDLAGIVFVNFPWIETAVTNDLEAVLASGNTSTNYMVVNGMTNTSDLVITNGNLVMGESEFIPTASFIHRKDNDGQLLIDGGREGEGGEIVLTGPDLVGTENEIIIRANGGITIKPKSVSPPAFYFVMSGGVVRIAVDMIPDTNGVRNLGSPTFRIGTLYISTNSIDMDTVIISAVDGGLLVNGTAVITNNSGPFNAAGATNLSADNVAAGTLADARLSATVSLLGQTIELTSESDLNATALTNINASQVTLGTLADLRLTANVDLLDGTRAWTDDHNAGGQPLTNLDTTVTLGMDDGSFVFVDGTDIFYVSADGTITNDLTLSVLVGSVRFRADLAAINQVIPTASDTTLLFSNTTRNVGSFWNTDGRQGEPPVAGDYVIGASVSFMDSIAEGVFLALEIHTNGVRAKAKFMRAGSGGGQGFSVQTKPIPLATNDIVTVIVRQNSGGDVDVDGRSSLTCVGGLIISQ